MDKTCWFCSDFSACWCGKINIENGCFIVGLSIPPTAGCVDERVVERVARYGRSGLGVKFAEAC